MPGSSQANLTSPAAMGVGRMSGGVAPAEMLVAMVMRLRYGDLYLPTGDSGLEFMMGYYLGKIDLGNCVNMNGAPRIRTPSRRSGARSCHAPGGMAA